MDCAANCSDADISAAVRGRIFHVASLPSAYISVSTVNGVVYLHGAVITSVERDAALAAASQVAGVVRVVNSIEINGDE
jgi:osmotically-inducible protein OsmY